jgi:tetratricopeptide (TPR) repeat protein
MIRVRKPGGRKAEEGPCRADGGGPAGRGLGGCHCERSEDSGSKEPAITGQATRADNPACHTPHSTLHTSLAFAIAVLWTVHPLQVEAVTYIGDGLAACGKLDEAIAHYRKALQIAPDFAVAQYNLGNVLAARGRVDEAIVCYHKALKSEPEFWMVHNNLGNALFGRGQFEESIAYYQQALALKPDSVDVRRNLSFDLSERVKLLRTLAERREAMRLRPNDAALLNHVAWMLATNPNASVRNGGEAVELAQRAVKVSGGQEAVLLDTLAAAYAEGGRFAEAVQTAERALALATIRANAALAQKISERLRLYRAGLPFRDSR